MSTCTLSIERGVVDRCAEATYRAVPLDAYDAAFACELKKFLVELRHTLDGVRSRRS